MRALRICLRRGSASLAHRSRRTVHLRLLERSEEACQQLRALPAVREARVQVNNTVEAVVEGTDEACCDLLAEVVRWGFRVIEFTHHRADLEDVFMNVTRGEVQ